MNVSRLIDDKKCDYYVNVSDTSIIICSHICCNSDVESTPFDSQFGPAVSVPRFEVALGNPYVQVIQ